MPGKPKPSNIRKFEGNPGHRPINEHEPQPSIGAECPKYLVGDAKRLWAKYAPMMEGLKILTKADESAFATLCQELATYWAMQKLMRKEGISSKYHNIADRSLGKAKALLGEFGMTPSSRTRLSISGDEPDEMGDIINLKRGQK